MVSSKPSVSSSGEAAWIGMDDVLTALQATMRRADEKLSKAKGDIQYVATNLTVSFPVEMNVQADRTMVRFPSWIGKDIEPVPESHLSRITFSLKPVPFIEEEAKESPTQQVSSPAKQAKPARKKPKRKPRRST